MWEEALKLSCEEDDDTVFWRLNWLCCGAELWRMPTF